MSRAFRRYWSWLILGALVGVGLGALAIAVYTRTTWGRERLLTMTLSALGGRLNGDLAVRRLDGNVLTGAKLYGISLTDPRGDTMIVADSAFLEYKLPTFVGGDVVINRVALYQPKLLLVRLPLDTLWNYQMVLQDTTRETGGAAARATLIESMRLVNADVTVLMPWAPTEGLSPGQQERQVRAALSDTSRLVVDRAQGGYVRTMRFAFQDVGISELIVAPDERGGTYLRVDSARGDAFLWKEPAMRLRDTRGELVLREGVMRFHAPEVVLPDSRAAIQGVVDVTGDELRYDVGVDAQRVSLRDLQWLNPTFPEEGSGSLKLWMETRPEGILFLAREMRLTAPGTRVQGSFGMVLGDTLRFVEANLTASPLNLQTVERMLPGGLPVSGLRIGGVEIRPAGRS